MKKLLILLVSASLLLTTSCGDDDNSEPAFEFDCTYLKVKEGSKLTQKYVSAGSSTETTVTSEVIDETEVANTQVAVFENDAGQQSFVTCDGDKFIVTAGQTTTVDGTTTVENILLTLDLGRPVGESYEAATIVSTTTVQGYMFETVNRYEGKVVEKDLTMEVEGTSYTDVVKFELESYTSSSLDPGVETFTTTTTYYMAPEVATIMTEIYDETQGFVSTTITLISYEY